MSNVSAATKAALSKGPLGGLLGGTSPAQKAAGEAAVARMKAQLSSSSSGGSGSSAPKVSSPGVSSPSGGGSSGSSSKSGSDVNKWYAEFKAQTIIDAGGKATAMRIDPGDRYYLESTPEGRKLLADAEKANPAVVASTSTTPASTSPEQTNTNYALLKAQTIIQAGGKPTAFTITASDRALLEKSEATWRVLLEAEKANPSAVAPDTHRSGRVDPASGKVMPYYVAKELDAKREAAAQQQLSLGVTRSDMIAALKAAGQKGVTYDAWTNQQLMEESMRWGLTVTPSAKVTEEDIREAYLSTWPASPKNVPVNVMMTALAGTKTDIAKFIDVPKPEPEPVKAMTPQETTAYIDKILEGVPTVKEAEAQAKKDAELQKQAESKLALEAFTEAGKEAQKEALATGQPVTLTTEKIEAKKQELLETKYAEGILVVDKEAQREATNVMYAGMKAGAIVEGAKAGTGSAFTLTDTDVKLLEKGGVTPEVAKQVQALPEQMKDYNVASAKVEKMLESAAKGQSPTVQLTAKDVEALEAVGFDGLQDKTGLTVAKPSEINSYVDYLTGKGAADDAYGQPSMGVGLQPKTPFVYEFLGPRGEVMKGNLAIVKYEAPDPTNPYKVVKVYSAPAYGPQKTEESSNVSKAPLPTGDPIADFAAGAKAPLHNLMDAAASAAHSVEVMFNPSAALKRTIYDSQGNIVEQRGPPTLDYKSEIEGDLIGLGVKAATDTATTGKTDVSMKDLEQIGKNIQANIPYALGSLAFSAATFIGPGLATKGAKIGSAGVKAAEAQKTIEPLILRSRSTLPKTFENVSIDRMLNPQKYEIASDVKVSLEADNILNISLESGHLKYPIGKLTPKGFEMFRTEKAVPEPLPTIADIMKSIGPEGRLSVRKVAENVSPDYAIEYGKAAQKIDELARQPPEGFLVPRSQVTEYVDQIIKTGKGEIEFGKVPQAGERPASITMSIDETLEGASKAAAEKVIENVDLERLLHPTTEIKLAQPDTVKQRGLVFKQEEIEGYTFYEKYIAKEPVAVEYKKIPSEFGTMKDPLEYAKKAPVVLPVRQELVTTSELFKFSELRRLLSTPEGIQRFLGKAVTENIGTRPGGSEVAKAIQAARPEDSILRYYVNYENVPILRNIAHQFDLGESATRIRTGALSSDELTVTKEFERAPAGSRFFEEKRPVVLSEREARTIEEEMGEHLLNPQRPQGLPKLSDIVKYEPYVEPLATGAPFRVEGSVYKLPPLGDIMKPNIWKAPATSGAPIKFVDESRLPRLAEIVKREIHEPRKTEGAAFKLPADESGLPSLADIIKQDLYKAPSREGAPFTLPHDDSGLPKLTDIVRPFRRSKQEPRRLSDSEVDDLWDTLEGKKAIEPARNLMTRAEQGRFAGDLLDDEIARVNDLVKKARMFSSESVDLGKSTVDIQKAAEDASKAVKPKERRLIPKTDEMVSGGRGKQETILEKPEQPKPLSDAEMKALLKKVKAAEGTGTPGMPGVETAAAFGVGAALGAKSKKAPKAEDLYWTARYPPETESKSAADIMKVLNTDIGKMPDVLNMIGVKPLTGLSVDVMLKIGEKMNTGMGVDLGNILVTGESTKTSHKTSEAFRLIPDEPSGLGWPSAIMPKFDFDTKFDFKQVYDTPPPPDETPIKIPKTRWDDDGAEKYYKTKKFDTDLIMPHLKGWRLLTIESVVGGGWSMEGETAPKRGSKKGRGRRR